MTGAALAFGRGLLGWCRLCWRSLGYRTQGAVKSFWPVVSFKFTRFVDELLALGACVGLCGFGFAHGLSLHWFVACREVCHE